MTIEQQRATPAHDEAELERLLREFFAAEIPAALRDASLQRAQPPVPAARATGPARRPLAGALGLTAVVASLLLALSAALWTPRAAQPPDGGGHAGRPDATAAGPQPRAPDLRRGDELALPAEPVERQGRSRTGVPAGASRGDGAHENPQFPELDIRIIPIEEDR